MRALALSCLFACLALAQADPGTLRGVLIERDTGPAGEFAVRAPDYHVHRYRYDPRTAVDRNRDTIDAPGLRPGEQVEVISEAVDGDPLRYASAIHVTVALPPPVTHRPPPASRLRQYNPQEERQRPKGDLSFSGVIVRVDGPHLVLRTRTEGEKIILLRQDTRYLENGELAGVAALKPTMHVFVRGSRNLYGDLEGYQVAWGEILEVK